ncbi:MAG: HlyD family efflux transporter periplasmic adaptor subunit [Neisseriaceae bacterium]|nr:HlyD family efflux transporter periplasmic adaptor subunit [Neisseriaceae bacterium]
MKNKHNKAPTQAINTKDLSLINDLNAALQVQKHPKSTLFIKFLGAFIIIFIIWAYFSKVEEVSRGQGSIIPSSREQIVQSLDPGIILKMNVKEGDIVQKNQVLIQLDDTRSSAILRESAAKVDNLAAMATRLQAEAYNIPLRYSEDTPAELIQREMAAYHARKREMNESVTGLKQSKAILDKEIAITKPMVNQGVVSEVELLRMERQSSELNLKIIERINGYKTNATNELVKIESELAQARENRQMRADPVERSLIRAPMKGTVKNIRINTLGGVVTAGEPILEIVPLDEQLIVEAYVKPRDVAFLRPGLPAVVKLSAYDYALYGGLEGELMLISPDTLKDAKRPSDLNLNPDEAYYRIIVKTKTNSLTDKHGKPLPIIPGMIANVDIKTGEKTIFQYLIKPITRLKSALSER